MQRDIVNEVTNLTYAISYKLDKISTLVEKGVNSFKRLYSIRLTVLHV